LSYFGSDNFECTSASFASTQFSIDPSNSNIIVIQYTGRVGKDNDFVTITCTNWRNPIVPEVISGFSIKTFLSDPLTEIDSGNFELDASNFTAQTIDSSLISYSVSPYSTDEAKIADYTISFESPIPLNIETSGECYVKYTIPPELDFS
jgi:hypothetical protein